MPPKKEITLHGRTYDMTSVADAVSVQAELVPENWPGNKSDCVRLMLALQDMLAHHLKRHIAANWQKICGQIQENKDSGEGATLGLSFKFEIDQSVPLLAAIRGHSLKYSISYGTTGRPDKVDLTQGELVLDPSETVDAGSLGQEAAEAEEFEKQAKADEEAEKLAEKERLEAEKAKTAPVEPANGDKKVAKRRGRPKKSAG